jgi:hypothetical protein
VNVRADLQPTLTRILAGPRVAAEFIDPIERRGGSMPACR